jgi:photoactive yellow protein
MNGTSPHFDTPNLARAVEQLSMQQIDALPFGAIQLDAAHNVLRYSQSERDQSAFPHPAIGRSFFTEIAPCMNNPAFKDRIDAALTAGRLDIEFDHIGDFTDPTRSLQIRIQSASGGGCWIFIRRDLNDS